jgi:hypothetical protein
MATHGLTSLVGICGNIRIGGRKKRMVLKEWIRIEGKDKSKTMVSIESRFTVPYPAPAQMFFQGWNSQRELLHQFHPSSRPFLA